MYLFFYKSKRRLCAFKYIKNNYISGVLRLFAIDFVLPIILEPDTVELIPTFTCEFYVTLLLRCLSSLPHLWLAVPDTEPLCFKVTDDTNIK